MAEAGGLLNAPDVYMDKIAVGAGLPTASSISTRRRREPEATWPRPRRRRSRPISSVCILDRPRHAEIIAKVREAGARIMLISDGDVSRRDRHRAAATAASTSIWARAARPKACWLRRRCAASAARCRAGWCSATTTSAAAPRDSASRTSTANTGCSISPRATSCSPRPASPRAPCCTGVRRFAGGAVTHSMVMRSQDRHGALISRRDRTTAAASLSMPDGAGRWRSSQPPSSASSARCPAARWRAARRPTTALAWRWRSASACPRSSAGCWPRAASARGRPSASSRRPCATVCPTRRISRTWTGGRAPGRARSSGGEPIARLRRLRRRRRDLGGAAACASSRAIGAACRSTFPTAARGLWPERAGAAAGSRRRARAWWSPSIAASPRMTPLAAARRGRARCHRRRPPRCAEPALPPALAVVNPNRLDEASRPRHAGGGRASPSSCWSRAQPRAAPAPAGIADRPEPDLRAMARSGGAGHDLRRGAAGRLQPRPGGAGAEGDGRPRQSRAGGAGRRGRRRARRPTPITPASSWGRGSMPAGGSARPISARGCCRPTIRPRRARWRRELDALNAERQEIEAAVLDEAIEQVESADRDRRRRCWWWPARAGIPGVIGIVAGRLRERYNRPACVVALADGIGKGSGRSVAGRRRSGRRSSRRARPGLLLDGGGHAMAAGFTVAARTGSTPSATSSTSARRRALGAAEPVPELGIDGALAAAAATVELVRACSSGSGPSAPAIPSRASRSPKLRVAARRYRRRPEHVALHLRRWRRRRRG